MIQANWYDAHRTIIGICIDDKLTLDILNDSTCRTHDLALSVNYPVTLMIELSKTVGLPPRGFVDSIREAVAVHQDVGLHTIVYITPSQDAQTLWQEAIYTYAVDTSIYFFVHSRADALALIQQRIA